MKNQIKAALIFALVASTTAKPVAEPKAYAESYGYSFNPLAEIRASGGRKNPFIATPASQFFARDEIGQYNYGYSNGQSSKQEVKSADGVVRGSYSFIDAHGKIRSVDYISDIMGFRSAERVQEAASIPLSQATLTAVPAAQYIAAKQAARPTVLAPTIAYTHLPYATNYEYFYEPTPIYESQIQNLPVEPVAVTVAKAAEPVAVPAEPVAVAAEPVAVAAEPVAVAPEPVAVQPAVGVSAPAPIPKVIGGLTQTQYHAQDELGQYQFGYADPNSARTELKTVDGVVRGAYNYVDDQGKIQTVEYIADKLGFRAVGTNVPVQTYELPSPVVDTPEVAAAKAEHIRLLEETRARDAELETLQTLAAIEEVVPVEEVVVKAAEPIPAQPEVIDEAVVPVQTAVSSAEPVAPVAVPTGVTSTQYHAQDELGQYNYGYSNQDSSKVEQRLADGSVRGAYTYIDANGQLQRVNYISDALGFRVAGTNIPTHNVAASSASPTIVTPTVTYSHLPYAVNYDYYMPGGVTGIPSEVKEITNFQEVVAEPAGEPASVAAVAASGGVVSSQYHAQDELGQYNYGYSNPLAAKQETKSADGVVRGSYSYVDANGVLQSVNYISDALGFRAAGTNIPTPAVEGDNQGDSMIQANVAYSHLPYAFNHPYYY